MSEPCREHVEAVARVTAAADAYIRAGQLTTRWESGAEDILTSTDPAVLDAMQDALVRAGRLTEEWSIPDGLAGLQRRTFGTEAMARGLGREYGKKVSRRLVTEWRETKGGDDA